MPVGQPDGGVSPLASGINISSSDLTPPLPGPGAGTISPGASAVLQFDLRVNPGTPAGTLISNQAVVDSVELPNLLTDGDGNPATGPNRRSSWWARPAALDHEAGHRGRWRRRRPWRAARIRRHA